MHINVNNEIVKYILGIIQHYNPKKYWKCRAIVIDKSNKHILNKCLSLFYVKRCDAYNCASFGTDFNKGAIFKTIPHLPHGLKGIIIHPGVVVGEYVTIYQHVTIGKKNSVEGVPRIGDNVTIGAGAAILGEISIGNNVIIGANAVVITDVPDNCLAVGVPAKIIENKNL